MKVLLAVDGSEGARKATEWVRDLARKLAGLEVTLLQVVKPVDFRYVAVESGGSGWQRVLDELEAGARERARGLVEETEGSFPAEARTTVMVTVGDPATEIVNTAREIGADLIVVGSRGLGQVKGILLGSVSDRVVHLANCPVLVVR